jgi:hypothetical protein
VGALTIRSDGVALLGDGPTRQARGSHCPPLRAAGTQFGSVGVGDGWASDSGRFPLGISEPHVKVYRYRDHREVQHRMADNDTESPEGGNEDRDLTMAAGFGAAIGIIVGSVVFAITQNPVWIGIGIPFGAAFGFAFGRYLRRLDDDSPLVAIFGPLLISGYHRDKG